jgi:hypothetical protein
VLDWIAEVTGASSARFGARIQTLWSGYGQVCRIELVGAAVDTVVLKWVAPPKSAQHPRGWSSDISHQRKLRSYGVELAFWREVASRCDERCRVPRCYGARRTDEDLQFVLEDLDASGFPERRRSLTATQIEPCLRWLAAFHATFMGETRDDLWPVGTYWHLETRPDELAAIDDPALRSAATKLDAQLARASAQTVVHGDAKVANFCFAPNGQAVAAVDFQYVGGGPGIKDVAYLFSSCFDGDACERHASRCLDVYFACLRQELEQRRPDVNAEAVEREWRELYPVAWADFVRFLAGWAPEHTKLHHYSERMLALAIDIGDD